MNEQLFSWILGLAGTIIILLLGVVGYFLKQNLEANTTLTHMVNRLDKTLAVVSRLFTENKTNTQKRLNSHAVRLDKHQADIEVLKSKVK